MHRGRRLRAIAYRSIWDAREGVWYDVKLWFVVTLLVAGLSAWRGLPWRSFLVLTVLALIAVLSCVFAWHFVRNLRHPDQHEAWRRGRTLVLTERDVQAPASLTLTLEPRKPAYGGLYRVEVTDPDGNVWLEASPIPEAEPRQIRRLQTIYPVSFPDAPALRSGSFGIRWLVGTKRGGWRELLRYEESVNL
jgi:hypothetical protein